MFKKFTCGRPAVWFILTNMKPILLPVLMAAILPGFLACSKKEPVAATAETEAATPPASGMAITHAPEGSQWDAAAGLVRHLEFGGSSFAYESHDSSNSTIELLLGIVDKILAESPQREARIRLSPAWEKLGWNRVVGSGSSCRKLGKLWHHRGVLYAPKEKPLFFPVFGKEAKPWRAAAIAPVDSDLVLEFSLDVPYALDMIGELAKVIGPKAASEWDAQMAGMKSDKISKGILEASKGTITIFLRLDPDRSMDLPEQLGKFPVVQGGVVLSSPEFAAFGAKMMKEKDAPPSEERADGSIVLVQPPSDPTMPKPTLNPTGLVNQKEGIVLMADSPETLALIEAKDRKLSESGEFKAASKNLPAEGNAMIFVSTRMQKELGELAVRFGRQMSQGPDAETAQVASFLQDIAAKAILSQAEPQMAVLKADADGWVWGANVSFERLPIEGAVVPLAVMSTIGYSAFEKARETANLTQAVSAGKQLYLAAMGYASDRQDSLPSSISDLVPAYVAMSGIDAKLPGVPPEQHWIFLTEGKTAISNGNLPIFVLNGQIKGKQVVVLVNGSVQALPPEQVRAMIDGQR